MDPVSNENLEIFQEIHLVRALRRDIFDEIVEMTMVNNVLHSVDDKPAYKQIDKETGQDQLLKWYKHGLADRDGKPSTLGYFRSGKLAFRHWHKEDQPHRLDGPSIEEFDEETGNPVYFEYRKNGIHFKIAGPAIMQIDPKTRIATFESWYTESKWGMEHREEGPARTCRDANTGIAYEQIWLQQGRLFRPEGKSPVVIRDRHTGEVLEERSSHHLYPETQKPELSKR